MAFHLASPPTWHGSDYVESSSVLIRTTTTSMTEIVHVEETTSERRVEEYLETDLDGYVVSVWPNYKTGLLEFQKY